MPATATQNRPADDQHFLLEGLAWSEYEAILGALGDQRVFVTFDRGRVELMSPSFQHKNRTELLNKLVWAICDGLNQPAKAGGSTTFQREDFNQGLEPDKCFWLQNESAVRNRKEIDLSTDPPPDLCIEVEVSHRLLDRVEIYAQLRVPELWRDDGKSLRLFRLSDSSGYVEIDASLAFPLMPAKRLNRYLDRAHGLDEITWSRKVRRAARKLRR